MNKTKISISVLSSILSIVPIIAQNKKPNVVFILADDLGYGDISPYGQKIIETPNLQYMADNGLKFTDFYAGSTVSAPSRASLMTGLNTGHTKIRGNKEIQPVGQEPMADRTTIADLFKNAKYRTGIFGKWGLGYPKSGAEPLDRGFDTFFGYNCQRDAHHYYPENLYEDRDIVLLNENKNDARQTYAPELIQEKAKKFISYAVKDEEPFFAYLTYTLPHAELNLPHDEIYQKYRDKLSPKPWNDGGYPATEDAHSSFAAMVTRLDKYVGEIIDLLKEKGVYDNTIIIFTSDNGPHLEGGADPDYFDSNANLRGYKRDLYEGGIRVPMLVVWNNVIKKSTTTNKVAAFWDMLPTFKELLSNKEKIETNGISLINEMKKPSVRSHRDNDRAMYWEFHAYGGKQAIRKGKWKLVVNDVDTDKPKIELYNLNDDIGETTDLSAKYPKMVNKLLREMEKQRIASDLFPFNKDKK